ncbi:hypothetical protein QVD99_003360 [Batrachochytrium dendrobatidis]|nr:hypothetical protein QVD99_003360 [Batrachochytrium dendrobatidis]
MVGAPHDEGASRYGGGYPLTGQLARPEGRWEVYDEPLIRAAKMTFGIHQPIPKVQTNPKGAKLIRRKQFIRPYHDSGPPPTFGSPPNLGCTHYLTCGLILRLLDQFLKGVIINVALMTLSERKIMGSMQRRIGPNVLRQRCITTYHLLDIPFREWGVF